MPSASVSTATAVKPGFLNNWRKANLRSFIAQCLHRIDSRRAASGQIAGQKSDRAENDSNSHERERVGGLDFVEQLRHQACQSKCACHTDSQPDTSERHPVANDEPHYFALLRAERHANPDLVLALRDGISQHTIDADGREHERKARENPDQNEIKTWLPDGIGNYLFQRRD